MKKLHTIIAALAMFILILAILITSVQLAVYGDPEYKFYEKEYVKYEVTEDLDMKLSDVMEVTDYMMSYLIGGKEELSIITTVEGEEQDFFNDQDRAHMADVRNLFLGGLHVRNICLGLFFSLIVLLVILKADFKKLLIKAYTSGVGIFLAAVLVIGLLFASDFTKYFTIFHKIFFTNDLWIFDPDTDYMIRMLPEGFFSDMALRISLVFAGTLIIVWAVMFVIRYVLRRKSAEE